MAFYKNIGRDTTHIIIIISQVAKVYPVPRTSLGRHEDIYWTYIGLTYVRTDPKRVLWTSYEHSIDLDVLWITHKFGYPVDYLMDNPSSSIRRMSNGSKMLSKMNNPQRKASDPIFFPWRFYKRMLFLSTIKNTVRTLCLCHNSCSI